jgi:hypothetical protein
MNDECMVSRRSLLRRAAGLAGVGLAGAVVPVRLASAQQKVSKEAMKYQDKANGDMRCDNCMQFVAPSSCKVVDGTISPSGYCIAWVKKA